MIAVIVGFVMPRYYDAFVPIQRRGEGTEPTVASETKGELAGKPIGEAVNAENGHAGLDRTSSEQHTLSGDKHYKEDRHVNESVLK